ncbi:MAG: CotH kinase family protein [Pirellulales bacterium]
MLSSQDRRSDSVSFRLSSSGEYLALVRPDATVAHAFAPAYPPQYTDVSYGIAADGVSVGFLASPTPGAANLQLRSEQVQFDRSAGLFSDPFVLTLSVETPGTTIHYTTDNSLPSEGSPVYTEPLVITETTRVRAVAVTPGLAASTPASEWFVRVDSDLEGFTSNLPIVALDSFGGGRISDQRFEFHAMSIFEPDPVTGRSSLFDTPALQTRAGLKIRGSSTARQPKKSFRVETWDARGMDQDIEPLGLPADSDWILYAPYTWDRAMLRNVFMYQLSNEMGRYAVRTRFVEVYQNTDGGDLSADDYRGVYVLMETIKRGADRVDVERLRPTDVTEPDIAGGWMLKIDRPDPGETGFVGAGKGLLYVEPRREDVTPEQAAWIKDYFDALGTSLGNSDPETGYAQFIDVDSWIDHHILNVLAMNADALRLSTFLHKRRDGKVEMGPIWDFDRALESEDGRDDDPNRWSGGGDATAYFDYPWWNQLFDSPDFWQKWVDRWTELRQTLYTDQYFGSMIDRLADQLAEAEVRNFELWSGVRPNGGRLAPTEMDTWRGELVNMKNWLSRRMKWIDDQLLAPPVITVAQDSVPETSDVQLSAVSGTIYYTVDRSDPRLPGGTVNPEATAFNREITFVDASSAATYEIPTGAVDETGWQELDFDDTAWARGQAGLGYDTGTADDSIEIDGAFTLVTARSTGRVTDLAAADALLAASDPDIETTSTQLPHINLLDGTNDGRFDGNRAFPNGGGDDFAIKATATLNVRAPGVYTFGVNAADGARLRIDGQDILIDDTRHGPQDTLGTTSLTAGPHDLELVLFERTGGASAELFFASGIRQQFSSDFVLLGTSDDQPFADLIETDTLEAMCAVSSGVYLRIPFVASDVDRLATLGLKMRYDDGFVAYLNGVEIARRNVPETLTHDSAAVAPRGDRRAVVDETIDVSSFIDRLREGDNVLAIHGLNADAADADFLVRPQLVGAVTSDPLLFSQPAFITARAMQDGRWSAPIRQPVIRQGGPDDTRGLVISEINYNPHPPSSRELAVDSDFDNDDFEFVELVNTADHPIDVGGVVLSDGIDFTFLRNQGLLEPNERLTVVRDRRAFETRYGTTVTIDGVFDRGLNNRNERLVLADRLGNIVQDFYYRDAAGWPTRADGGGSSLEVVDFAGDYNDPSNWRSSREVGGSPGSAGTDGQPDVLINELTFNGEPRRVVSIELRNVSDRSIDVSGWYVSDDVGEADAFSLPQGSLLEAGGTLALNAQDAGWLLDAEPGGELLLSEPDSITGQPRRFVDLVQLENGRGDASLGRWPDGDPESRLIPMRTPTLGDQNSGPPVGALVMTELFAGKRFVRLHESFDAGAEPFVSRIGVNTMRDGRLEVSPTPLSGGDAAVTMTSVGPLPGAYRLQTTLAIADQGASLRNAALIFDYQGPTEFKFALVDANRDLWQIGQRDVDGWNFLSHFDEPLDTDRDYRVTLEVRGSTATLLDGDRIVGFFDFGEPLNNGEVGLGSRDATARFEEFTVEVGGDGPLEFVELFNTTSDAMDIGDWQLTGDVRLTFPTGTIVSAGQTLVAVGFDPEDTGLADAFREGLDVDQAVELVGPFYGAPVESGGAVELTRPLTSAEATDGFVVVDRARYESPSLPPRAAFVRNRSLSRVAVDAFGRLPTSWITRDPTPGSVDFVVAGDANLDGEVGPQDIGSFVLGLTQPTLYEASFGVLATRTADTDGDGDVDFDDIRGFVALLEGDAAAGTQDALSGVQDTHIHGEHWSYVDLIMPTQNVHRITASTRSSAASRSETRRHKDIDTGRILPFPVVDIQVGRGG